MFAFLQNSYVKNLMPKIMVLGGGDFGRWVDHEGRTFKRMRLYERAKSLQQLFVQFFGTPWTAAGEAPLSVGFSRQEYWMVAMSSSRSSSPSRDRTHISHVSVLAGRFLTTSATWEAHKWDWYLNKRPQRASGLLLPSSEDRAKSSPLEDLPAPWSWTNENPQQWE